MKYRKMLLFVFSLIAIGSTSRSEALVRTSSEQSDRERTRDAWQRPAEVFDAMALKPGHRVADIGCGFGYFTFRLAAQVGAEGKIYAVDIDPKAIEKVRQRKERENLDQVEPILGESNDPRLPNDLDSVLIVDSYHEFREYDRMMQAVFHALKPGGRLVIIDAESPQAALVPSTIDCTASLTSWYAAKSLETGLSSKKAGPASMMLSTARNSTFSSSSARCRTHHLNHTI